MERSTRSAGMETPGPIVLIVGACGALVAAVVAAMIGSGLRIPPRLDPETQTVIVPTNEVFADGAPAYPSLAPEPLYPGTERDPMDEFATAWDDAMTDRARNADTVVFRPPSDLPPPYEVRIDRAAPPVARSEPRDARPARPADEGRYRYRGYDAPPAGAQTAIPTEDDRSRY